MPCIHEFGIIDSLEDYNEDKYEPKKYNCISVDDDFLTEIYHAGLKNKIKNLETFAHNVNRPFKGLAYCGITLIPTQSLKYFLDIIVETNLKYKSKELKMLIEKIFIAIKENKWMIHYGI
ncbi:hypothetical protein [Tepidibacter thalassicus]|uniref:Uncharacterized protein n=1 Tax=Tepidibacter thalassicus DSM 15285 TaxID=1123350 RepID=A0A1M5SWK0_9FIRM|nr:hypothetical protein [Tepidibacter thalassicus]SHH42961.1 hypothetical protein SAMN02744040_01943 [Tepidibacter thalassicus DSM 15285]